MFSMSVVTTAVLALLTPAWALQRFPLSVSELQHLASEQNDLKGGLTRRQAGDPQYPAYTLAVPIDHFHNDSKYEPHSGGKFPLRYWFDAQFYKPGGPVIVLGAGETSGVGRLPFLQKGIVYQLTKATGGLGVILEHRYYGASVPVSNFSTKSLRFLTTEQALADTAYFAKNVKFPGLEHLSFNPETTPWIAYGGSYAGAFVAFLRKVYPNVFWGAISSSGVPMAIWDYWKYFEAAAVYGPPECVKTTQKLTHVVDNILIGRGDHDPLAVRLKTLFGMGNLTHNDDFGNAINGGIYGLQSYNWDPEVGDDSFFKYCLNVSSDDVLYQAMEDRRAEARALLAEGRYGAEVDSLTNRFLNYIGYVNLTTVSKCTGRSQDACWTSRDSAFYRKDDLSQTWRLWQYQVCTEWGYLQTGSGVPANQLPLISRLIDLEYSSIVCREAFNLTEPAKVENINKFGGFDIKHPRLAFVDGEWDPWRAAGIHAIGQPRRASTASEPAMLIPGAVHHWDENGVFPNETHPGFPPPQVVDAQGQMAMFVQIWLMEWKLHCMVTRKC